VKNVRKRDRWIGFEKEKKTTISIKKVKDRKKETEGRGTDETSPLITTHHGARWFREARTPYEPKKVTAHQRSRGGPGGTGSNKRG